MTPNPFETSPDLLTRVSGPADSPVLVYLPGVHGDWTLMGELRALLAPHCRLIEIAYPHAASDWTLDDYAFRLAALFDRLALPPAHLLGESFGSLVAWEFTGRHPERVRSIILAGGFCASPGPFRVALGRLAAGLMPASLATRCAALYFRLRWRSSPTVLSHAIAGPEESFPAMRTRRGWRAIRNRLQIIARTDLRSRLCTVNAPVLYLGGARDIIVPVRREIATLRRQLPSQTPFHSELLPRASHAILPARPAQTARIIIDWINASETLTQ